MTLHVKSGQAEVGEIRPARASEGAAGLLPIVVDLDGPLVMSDTLTEAVITAMMHHPAALFGALPALTSGRQAFGAILFQAVDLSKQALPLRHDLVRWLSERAAEGHAIHLCSNAPPAVADAMARRLHLFTTAEDFGACGVDCGSRADYLASRFPDGFIYVGGKAADLPVWAISQGVVLAGSTPRLASRARQLGKPLLGEFATPPLGLEDILKFLRVHHWMKNLLLFAPLFPAHQWHDLHVVARFILAFFCLIAVTSGTYLLNDIADLDSDRRHWSKRNRALASGRLSIGGALAMAAILIGGGLVGAGLIAAPFMLVLLSYLALTLAYSFSFRGIPLLDVLVIGILFTLRVMMGAVLLDQTKPAWLLTFAVFFFVSLATGKRHTEIVRARTSDASSLRSRGYEVEDAPLTLTLGVATAIASLVVLFIFIVLEMLPGNTYGMPEFLAGIPLVLAIWLGRIWLLAHRGRLHDDPVSFAVTDRVSLMLGAMVAALFFAAL